MANSFGLLVFFVPHLWVFFQLFVRVSLINKSRLKAKHCRIYEILYPQYSLQRQLLEFFHLSKFLLQLDLLCRHSLLPNSVWRIGKCPLPTWNVKKKKYIHIAFEALWDLKSILWWVQGSGTNNFKQNTDKVCFNTQYMTNPSIVYRVKMEYGWKRVSFEPSGKMIVVPNFCCLS